MHVHCIILIGSVILDVSIIVSVITAVCEHIRERERERGGIISFVPITYYKYSLFHTSKFLLSKL